MASTTVPVRLSGSILRMWSDLSHTMHCIWNQIRDGPLIMYYSPGLDSICTNGQNCQFETKTQIEQTLAFLYK